MKPWKVLFTSPAARDFRRLQPAIAKRIKANLERFAETGHGDLARLEGSADEWRLRVGNWRVRLSFDSDTKTIHVLRVLPRKDAYRD